MKLKYLPILTTATAAILVVGCGGKTDNLVPLGPLPSTTGGSEGGSTGVTPGTIPPGTTMRSLGIGDMWKYTVSGRVTTQKNGVGGSSVPINGTLTLTVTEEGLNGILTKKITERLVYTPQGGVQVTRVVETYIDQDVTGAIRMLAKREHGVLMNVTSSDYALIGLWFPNASDSGQTTLVNDVNSTAADGQMSDTFSVMDQQDVVTALGKYGTWRAECSQASTTNYTGVHNRIDLGQFVEAGTLLSSEQDAALTEWWNPILGNCIRIEESSTTVHDKFVRTEVAPVGPPQIIKDVVVITLDLVCVMNSTTVR